VCVCGRVTHMATSASFFFSKLLLWLLMRVLCTCERRSICLFVWAAAALLPRKPKIKVGLVYKKV
jgi:hypothetical protein